MIEEATCIKEGKVLRNCYKCGKSVHEKTDIVPHKDDDKNHFCDVCGAFIKTETPPPTGGTAPVYKPSVPVSSDKNEPKIEGESGKSGWEAISKEIGDTPEGGTVTVDMNGTTELPKDIVK